MNNAATTTPRTSVPTVTATAAEAPADSGAGTAIPTVAASMFAQLAVRPAEAANDAVASSLDADHTSASKANSPPAVQLSRDRALTFNSIGPRLITARALNGIPQQEAAQLAGMGNGTQWSLWEAGRRAPPLYAVLAAAKTLGVSMDFLFGLSDDPERDARAARRNSCVRAVRNMLTQAAENIADGIEASDALAGPDASNYREMLEAARSLTEAVEQYHRLNVEQFEDSRGGATVLAAVSRMEQVQLKAREVLRRHDQFAERMRIQIAEVGPLNKKEKD